VVSFSLEGKVATVNGASRGIGEAIARAFAEQGATVVVSSRKQEALERVAASIRDAGGKAHAIACHSGKADEIERFFTRVESELGRLDVHVNNAAINPYFGPVIDTPVTAFDKTLEVDLRGYFLMTQAAARLMAKNGGGSIVNIGSVSGIIPGVNEGTYAICKAGVISMTRSFAKEMGKQHVRVNCIAPGPVETQFASVLFEDPDNRARMMRRIPLGYHGVPEDIAGAALYFASDASRYTTGAVLTIDGGITA
jgi:NAD(P)-dependent dehydrogenase (short-subunit alcohol dehydrogenase family)